MMYISAYMDGYMYKTAEEDTIPLYQRDPLLTADRVSDLGKDIEGFADLTEQQRANVVGNLQGKFWNKPEYQAYAAPVAGGTLGAGIGYAAGGASGGILGGTLGTIAGWMANTYFGGDIQTAVQYVADWINKGMLSSNLEALKAPVQVKEQAKQQEQQQQRQDRNRRNAVNVEGPATKQELAAFNRKRRNAVNMEGPVTKQELDAFNAAKKKRTADKPVIGSR